MINRCKNTNKTKMPKQHKLKYVYCSECGNVVAATFDDGEMPELLCFDCLYRNYECWDCLDIRNDVRYYEDVAQLLCSECYTRRLSGKVD